MLYNSPPHTGTYHILYFNHRPQVYIPSYTHILYVVIKDKDVEELESMISRRGNGTE